MTNCVKWLSGASLLQAALGGLALAAAIEAVTCLLRYGFGLQAGRDTQWLAQFTLGLRIHHGYIGVLLLCAAALKVSHALRNLLVIVGVGLVASDLVHHFIVLQTIEGMPQFHIHYRAS